MDLWVSPNRASCVPMNNPDPAGTWAVVSGIMAPNGHSYCPILPLGWPLLEGYQEVSAIWAMFPRRVPSKTAQPALEEWAQNPCRTGLEEADLGEEFTLSSEVSALPSHEAFLLPSSLGRLLLSQAARSHIALSSPYHGVRWACSHSVQQIPDMSASPSHSRFQRGLYNMSWHTQKPHAHTTHSCVQNEV